MWNRIRRTLAILSSLFATIALTAWTAIRLAVDWIGRSTVVEDAKGAKTMMEAALHWVFSTPWWVPGALATACVIALIYFLFSAGNRAQLAPVGLTATDSLDVKAQPDEDAKHSSVKSIPQRFIDLIDSQDKLIDFHILKIRNWVTRHFDAADPYIEINIEVKNSSLFDLHFKKIRGALYYDEDPLPTRPEAISYSVLIKPGALGRVCLRQFISSELRNRLVERRGFVQMLAPSNDFGLYFSYENRLGEEKEARWAVTPDVFDISEQAPQIEPDWNLSEAFEFWTKETDCSEDFPSALEQAAFDEKISVWGKRDYLNETVMEKIPSSHWSKSQIDTDPAIITTPSLLDEISILEKSRTIPRNRNDSESTQYWHLKVSSVEIAARFSA